jgi:H+/Cl- antiporter ClcA
MKNKQVVIEILIGIIIGLFGWLYLSFVHEMQLILFTHIPEHMHYNKEIWTSFVMLTMLSLISVIIYKKGTLAQLNQTYVDSLKTEKYNSVVIWIVLYFLIVLASGVGVGPEASLISIIVMLNHYRNARHETPKDKLLQTISIIAILVTLIAAFKLDGRESGFYKFNEYKIATKELLYLPILLFAAVLMMKVVDISAKKTEEFCQQSRIKKHYLPVISGIVLLIVMYFTKINVYEQPHNNHFLLFSGESGIVQFANNYTQITPQYGLLIGLLKFLMFILLVNTGLKGGAYFPYMFAAFAISYFVSESLGLNFGFVAIIFVTAALGIPNSKQVWLSAALVPLYFAWSSLIIIIPLCIFYSKVGTKLKIGSVAKH